MNRLVLSGNTRLAGLLKDFLSRAFAIECALSSLCLEVLHNVLLKPARSQWKRHRLTGPCIRYSYVFLILVLFFGHMNSHASVTDPNYTEKSIQYPALAHPWYAFAYVCAGNPRARMQLRGTEAHLKCRDLELHATLVLLGRTHDSDLLLREPK